MALPQKTGLLDELSVAAYPRVAIPYLIDSPQRDWPALTAEWVFFLYAPLHIHSGLRQENVDPLLEWTEEYATCPIRFLRTKRRIILGLDDTVQSHTIGIVRRELWPSLRDHLAGVAVTYKQRQWFARASLGELRLCQAPPRDGEFDLAPWAEAVTVYAFGVDSNKSRFELQQPLFPWQPALLVSSGPRPETVAMAKRIFTDDLGAINED